MHSVYWKDILKRIHMIILISCFKSLRWIKAIDNNVNNYYGFCSSSIRGLLESISDTFYTLYKVPLTIATVHKSNDNVPHCLDFFSKTSILHFVMEQRKEEAKRIIDSLPDNVSWDDIMYELYVCQKIEKAEKFMEEGGKTYTLEEAKKRLLNSE